MCGIFGVYDGEKATVMDLAAKIIRGLSLLEYRGYDSAGLLLQNTSGHSIICKTEGNVNKLKDKATTNLVSITSSPIFNIGISHTRWATHGKPSDTNSHPHTSDSNITFSVVHNGIITNYKDLKEMLISQGFTFETETDTEVIPKLCLHKYNENPTITFDRLVARVIAMLEGSFALLITSRVFPNEIVASKCGSPLILGNYSETCCLFSSDITALVDCKEIYVMQDKELFHITQNEGGQLYSVHNIPFSVSWTPNTTTLEDVDKGSYDTYMKKEIYEQPLAITRTIQHYTITDAFNHMGIQFPSLVIFTDKIRKAPAIFLIACGTSWHSCLASRWLLSSFIDKHVYVEVAGQFYEVKQKTSPECVYIFVSQSGETAETVEALRYVKSVAPSALCIGMTNKPGSTIAREAACSIELKAGLEISVASTKAYTSQMVALALFAAAFKQTSFKQLLSCLSGYQQCNLQASLIRVPDLIKTTLILTEKKVQDIALSLSLSSYKSFLFVGRGADYATALEAALKVKEIAYVHSEGIMASELKHGPLAMIDDSVCLFVFATRAVHYKKMVSVIEQLKARKAHMYVICTEDERVMRTLLKDPSHIIEVPHCDPEIQHIINIVPMQLLALHLATFKGNKVDQPRNLAKSVTVSD